MDDIAKDLCLVEGRGWVKGIFKKVDEAFICALCLNTCRDCVELSCDVEHTDEEFVVYCEFCLKNLFISNGNKCPINGHLNPQYSTSRSSRSRILKSQVICPNSLMFRKTGENTDNMSYDEEGGDGPGNQLFQTNENNSNNNYAENQTGCTFSGTLSHLISRHINLCCITQALSNPILQSKILQNMKKTTKAYANRIKNIELKDTNLLIAQIIENFHSTNDPNIDKNAQELKQLQMEFSNEQKLQNELEITINNNKQEIQELKDILSAIKRSFVEYKNEQQFIDYKFTPVKPVVNSGGNDSCSGNSKFESALIENEADKKLLASWIPGGNDSKRFILVFRASRDGWPASTFHSKCDASKGTVIIMRGTNGNIFGGYTSVSWDQSYRNWKTDNDAFLYLLKCGDGSGSTPGKYTVNSAATAIYAHSSYGPNWGNGPDLEIKSDENIVSDLENGSCSFSCPKNNKLFGGNTERTSKITDYEVFEVK